jgi:hypothetical protein
MTRHVVPIVATKFATECNIAVRNHIPMLKHWSEYKNQPASFDLFVARIYVKYMVLLLVVSEMQIFNLTCYGLTGNIFFHLNRLSLI